MHSRRVGVSLPVVLAVLLAVCPLLPPQHIHRAGIEGRTAAIVHAHVVEFGDSTPTGTSIGHSHGNHGLAIFLSTVFNSGPEPQSPPILLSAFGVVATPPLEFVCVVDPIRIERTHGPPGTAWLTRGPPSLS
jgi:hypothetical protein